MRQYGFPFFFFDVQFEMTGIVRLNKLMSNWQLTGGKDGRVTVVRCIVRTAGKAVHLTQSRVLVGKKRLTVGKLSLRAPTRTGTRASRM